MICFPHFLCSDGKVLVDLLKIHSDACHNCAADKEKVAVRLKGERTNEYEDGVPCHTNFLDRKHVKDYDYGFVEFDGRWKGQEDEQEMEMMGECFKVMFAHVVICFEFPDHYLQFPLNARVEGGLIFW